MNDLGLVLALAGSTYLIRASLVVLLAEVTIPGRVRQALALVAPAVMAGLVAQTLVIDGGEIRDLGSWYLAAAVAVIVAMRLRSVAWTLIAGMAAVWIFEALL